MTALPQIEWLLAYGALGAVVGFFAGLLGIGGGGIMVPMLTTLFALQAFPHEHIVHLALATSMTAIVMTAIASVRAHHAHRAVLWPVVGRMTPGILAGTFLTAFIASAIPTKPLAMIFVVFMSYVSVQMLLNIKPKPSRQLPGRLALTLVGLGIGSLSALVAIGGGSLTVPFLTWCNVKLQNAIATSSAIGLPIAVAGSLGYWLGGSGIQGLPLHSEGFIYWPAVLGITAFSMLTAPWGARLTHRLPVAILKKVFALMLMLLSAKMLHTVFTV